MKRLSLLGFGLFAAILAGCPVWSDGGNESQGTGNFPNGCTSYQDCPANYTCGSDNQCHPGDCTASGCPSGSVCIVQAGTDTAVCEPTEGTGGTGGSGTGGTTGTGASGSTGGTGAGTTTGTGASTSSGTTTGTGGAAPVVYCGHPADCGTGETCAPDGTCQPGNCQATKCIYGYTCQSNGTCVSPVAGACDSDADCAAGSLCIAGASNGSGGTLPGVCTTAENQCFDQSQCLAGEACVAGKCTPTCSSNSDCRDGYDCNVGLGVCTDSAQTCTVTNDCGSAAKVCVGGTCVPRAPANSMNCGTGDVWTENGCVPDQAASFTCNTDGQMGDGMAGDCAVGSICLHHDCWISCDPTNNQCATQLGGEYPDCKQVTESGMSYDVCGSDANLGGMCGEGAAMQNCTNSAQVCIDGYCE